MSENLFEKLYNYSESDIYPFCMPGHKRSFSPQFVSNPYSIDITEVEGFDDLQDCTGLLGEIQNDFAKIYGCRNVFMSVNGSSACNLAAIISLPDGGRILCASNCHRSVYNALKINKRSALFIDPLSLKGGLKGELPLQKTEDFFNLYSDIQALVVTSPTYEGFTSDIAALAEIVHKHGALLIVDEAHGAHLPFLHSGYFPVSALYRGADIVVQSLHKTLPSLNQTSLIFVPNDDALAANVKAALNMVMTTSPSYILMASAQAAVCFAAENPQSFSEYETLLKNLRNQLSSLKNIRLVDKSFFDNYNISGLDPGKLIFIAPPGSLLTGKELFYRLLKEYKLQLEKYEDTFALAMTSVTDTKAGFDRLKSALSEIDASL